MSVWWAVNATFGANVVAVSVAVVGTSVWCAVKLTVGAKRRQHDCSSRRRHRLRVGSSGRRREGCQGERLGGRRYRLVVAGRDRRDIGRERQCHRRGRHELRSGSDRRGERGEGERLGRRRHGLVVAEATVGANVAVTRLTVVGVARSGVLTVGAKAVAVSVLVVGVTSWWSTGGDRRGELRDDQRGGRRGDNVGCALGDRAAA